MTLLPTPVSDNSRGLPSSGTDYQSLPNAVVSLLPTPRATDGTKGGPNQRGSSGDLMLPSAVNLLPTPTTTQRGTDANLDTREGARANLHNEVANLLPTPSVADGMGGHLSRSGSRSDELLLPGVAKDLAERRLLPTPRTENNENRQSDGYGGKDGNFHGLVTGQTSWGDYADAITRWEALTRPAPAPTEPGAKGSPRLSPRFVEWMMGLPEGWVDVEGVSRNEQLKALGNGVVPQQVAAATRAFLADIGAASHEHRVGTEPAPSQLLPTPAVNDMGASYTPEEWDAWTAKMQAAHGNGNGHGKSLAIEAQRLAKEAP